MRRFVVRWGAMTLAAAAFLAAGPRAWAQGVTTSAITGVVTGQGGGAPIADAQVELKSGETGFTWRTTTRANGRYLIDQVAPGSNYTLTVRAIGYRPASIGNIQLVLNFRATRDVQMVAEAVQLEELAVTAPPSLLANQARTGPAQTVSDTLIQRLPLNGRNFTDLAQTSPQVVGSSVAGQNNRFNNIQIDGGVNNDLFGLAGNGTPGGQSQGRVISLEAVKEFQIQVSPFDVRQGNFTGGLINAITKSGTNTFSGSAFAYRQAKSLTAYRNDPTYAGLSITQYGGTFGGPLIKDRLHFFVAADIQARSTPFFSTLNLTGNDGTDVATVGFTAAQANRVADILATKYGVSGVGTAATPDVGNPTYNVFGKLSYAGGKLGLLEVSWNWAKADQDSYVRSSSRPGNASGGILSVANMRDGIQLSGSGYVQANNTNTVRAKLTTDLAGGKSNEFIIGYQRIRDKRDFNGLPLFLVRSGRVGANDTWVAAGGDRFSQANALDQDIFSVTENFSFGTGAHRFTVGTQSEFFKFRNVFAEGSIGVWQFNSADSLDAGTPAAFLRNVPIPGTNGGVADWNAKLFGFYAQDQFSVTDRFVLTYGLRADLPTADKPLQNAALLNDPNLPINTAQFPTGNLLVSPRVGFNWDVQGDRSTVVRGGLGWFAGRPPYVWLSNGFTNTGSNTATLYCTGANVPTFTADAAAQPTTCANGAGATAATATINYYDKNLKFPQTFRASLGLDRNLAHGLVGTLDFLFSKNVNQFYLQDANLQKTGTDGEGRAVYGTFAATGFRATPTRLTTNAGAAIRHTNSSGGRTLSVTGQLQKSLGGRVQLNAGYTYSNTTDVMSLTSSIAFSNFQFSAVDGTLADRNVRTSFFDTPHKVTLSGSVRLPYNFTFSAIYVGNSGSPYTWTVGGDVNADGVSGNDLPFIPASAAQISLQNPSQYQALSDFIDGQTCLRAARGGLLKRNSCRNPWQNFTTARLSWTTPKVGGQEVELTLDLFNVLRFLDRDWGLTKSVSAFEAGGSFLRAVGYDQVNNRPIYSFQPPAVIENIVYGEATGGIDRSRYRFQLGAKYRF